MSEISRRDALRRLGLALMATGALDRVAAQEVHHLAALAQAGAGPYTPKSFTPGIRHARAPDRPDHPGRERHARRGRGRRGRLDRPDLERERPAERDLQEWLRVARRAR